MLVGYTEMRLKWKSHFYVFPVKNTKLGRDFISLRYWLPFTVANSADWGARLTVTSSSAWKAMTTAVVKYSPPPSPTSTDFADIYLDESERDDNEEEDDHDEGLRPYMFEPTGTNE